MAFQSLGLSEFSVYDLNLAIEYAPYDENIFFILDQVKSEAGIEKNDDDEASKMEQHIFVENLQENFPRPEMNSKDIEKLFKILKSNIQRKEKMARSKQSTSAADLGNSETPFGGLGGGLGMGTAGLGGLGAMNLKEVTEIYEALKHVFVSFQSNFKKIVANSNTIVFFVAVLVFLSCRF